MPRMPIHCIYLSTLLIVAQEGATSRQRIMFRYPCVGIEDSAAADLRIPQRLTSYLRQLWGVSETKYAPSGRWDGWMDGGRVG